MFKKLAVAIIFLLPAFSYGQEVPISARVNISANVEQSIQLITVSSMNVGSLEPGQVEIYINPINDINAGYMIATGTPESEFRLTYISERNLTNLEGRGFLVFQYEISGNSIEDQSSSELLLDDNRDLQFNTEGEYFLWIGGRLNIENAEPGSYEGDFTIEIDYI